MRQFYSPDYVTARRRFREAAAQLGWQLETHAIGAVGPQGEELTVDVASSGDRAPIRNRQALVLSSGLHGVEGYFGSAVQVALLQRWQENPRSTPPLRCLFLHGLNPYGFAWLRRTDADNVDLNRNFLLPHEDYAGASQGYVDLDRLLNPRHPPNRMDLFALRAIATIIRQGMPTLRQAIAEGQYEFPQGLFFGGRSASPTNRWLAENFPRWLRGAQNVVHLDFHTGLGDWGTYKLLIDRPLDARQRTRLNEWFGARAIEVSGARSIAYDVRGEWGRWCLFRKLAHDYLYMCAEFGTYRPLQVLEGLRRENQAHHWGEVTSRATENAKARLKELFCPASESWQRQVLEQSFALVDRSVASLLQNAK